MKKLTNKRGISLIVLVITIIVMIILASAIILSLSSAGIIGKANEAKTASDNANLLQAANLAAAEWELAKAENPDTEGAVSYITNKLVAQGFKADEIEAKLNITDKGVVSLKGGEQNSEVSWEDASKIAGTAAATLQVGDYITYDSGVEGMTTTWKVLYNDADRGVQVIPSAVREKSISLNFNNIVEKLNEASQEYINATYAKSARAMGTNPVNPVDTTEYYNLESLGFSEEQISDLNWYGGIRESYYDNTDKNSNVWPDNIPEGTLLSRRSSDLATTSYIIIDCDYYLPDYDMWDAGQNQYGYVCLCWDESTGIYEGDGDYFNFTGYVLPVVTLYNNLTVSLISAGANSATNPYVISK